MIGARWYSQRELKKKRKAGTRRREFTNIYPWKEKFALLDALVRASTSE
jgi:hypothetical protein